MIFMPSKRPSRPFSSYRLPVLPLLLVVLMGLGACASRESQVTTEAPPPSVAKNLDLEETSVPDGPWRPHRLKACLEDTDVPPRIEKYLAVCSEYFRDGSGSDGMIELEMGLAAGYHHSLMTLTLGQLYLLAGQGDPDLLPFEGPASDVGDWSRNRVRLLQRAEDLLQEAATDRGDDAAVFYLLADVARARGDQAAAAELVAKGMNLCTGGRSFGILWQYQKLNRYPGKHLGGPPPEYPQSAVAKGLAGDVVIDVLVSPAGEIRQLVTVETPGGTLTEAAAASLRKAGFEAARVGKYPIWSWVRVTTAFNLD